MSDTPRDERGPAPLHRVPFAEMLRLCLSDARLWPADRDRLPVFARLLEQSLSFVFQEHGIRLSGLYRRRRWLVSAPEADAAEPAPPDENPLRDSFADLAARAGFLALDAGELASGIENARYSGPRRRPIPPLAEDIRVVYRERVTRDVGHGKNGEEPCFQDLSALVPLPDGRCAAWWFSELPVRRLDALAPDVALSPRFRDWAWWTLPAAVWGGLLAMLQWGMAGLGWPMEMVPEPRWTALTVAGIAAALSVWGYRRWLVRKADCMGELARVRYDRLEAAGEGVMIALASAAETMESRVALMVFHCLLVEKKPLEPAVLNERVAAWLWEQLGESRTVATETALRELDSLGVVIRENDRFQARDLETATAQLDIVVNGYRRRMGSSPASSTTAPGAGGG